VLIVLYWVFNPSLLSTTLVVQVEQLVSYVCGHTVTFTTKPTFHLDIWHNGLCFKIFSLYYITEGSSVASQMESTTENLVTLILSCTITDSLHLSATYVTVTAVTAVHGTAFEGRVMVIRNGTV